MRSTGAGCGTSRRIKHPCRHDNRSARFAFDDDDVTPVALLANSDIGAPHVSVEALVDLDRLLRERRLGGSYPDDTDVVQEACNEEGVTADDKIQAPTPVQNGVGFDKEGDECSRTQRGDGSLGMPPDGGRRRGERGERR
jgi:hypothetical protein